MYSCVIENKYYDAPERRDLGAESETLPRQIDFAASHGDGSGECQRLLDLVSRISTILW
jgi:hypothetical protein